MASILHGSARTTPRVRAELQASQAKTSVLAKLYGLSRTTVTKWRARSTTADAPMGPRDPRSTVLTPVEEAMIVAFRQRTLLPLDDVMGCLRDSIPKLTRSSLHRCLERHGISRLPVDETKTKRGRFAETTIGYVHIDSCEFRHADGKLHMFLAIDRVSKFTFVAFYENAGMMNGAAFLRSVIEAFPYQIHTVLTDNGSGVALASHARKSPVEFRTVLLKLLARGFPRPDPATGLYDL
jgi:transposase-like protein